jgi:hypothetical protein
MSLTGKMSTGGKNLTHSESNKTSIKSIVTKKSSQLKMNKWKRDQKTKKVYSKKKTNKATMRLTGKMSTGEKNIKKMAKQTRKFVHF